MKFPLVSILIASLFLGTSVLLAIKVGVQDVSLWRAMVEPQSMDRAIVWGVRLPRIALAVVSGGGLAIVGAAYQAMLRNPLAEPFVLGVSGGAALGATIAMAVGATYMHRWLGAIVPLSALAGGMAATALVYFIARATGGGYGVTILLAGIIVNAICSSAITFIKTLVSASKAQELLFWLMGFVDVPSPTALVTVSAYVAIGTVVLLLDSGRMNLLALGSESAQYLGINLRALERRVYVAASLVVGAIVSMTGLIGFVGLVVPHGVRRLVGPDHRLVLPVSFLGGAGMLVVCDLLSRVSFVWLGTEPPVGAVTALFGGPLFLALLRKRSFV